MSRAGILGHIVHKEFRRFFEKGICGVAEIFIIAGIEIVTPQMSCKPCASCHVHAPAHAPAGRGISPCVCNSMGNPAVAAIHLLSRVGSVICQKSDILEKRLIAFRKVGAVGTPVILSYVDIEMIVASPGHVACLIVVPDSLEIRTQGCAVLTRAGDQHVSAILEEKGVKTGIHRS